MSFFIGRTPVSEMERSGIERPLRASGQHYRPGSERSSHSLDISFEMKVRSPHAHRQKPDLRQYLLNRIHRPQLEWKFLIAVTAVKAFSISRRQKNRLGFLVGTACSVVLTIQMIVYVAANFGVPLVEPMTIPFLSYGGQSTLVNYILLGLILSVHRNKDIVSERHGTRGKWKIRLERIES